MASFYVLLASVVLAVVVVVHDASWVDRFGFKDDYGLERPEHHLWSRPRGYGNVRRRFMGYWPVRRYWQRRRYSPRYWRNGNDDGEKDLEKTLNASDPNVCTFKKAVVLYRSKTCWKSRLRPQPTVYHTEYKCCAGFKRVSGKAGCPKERYTSTMNIVDVAKELGLNTFLKYAGRVSVAKLLSGKENFTLFAPTDEAFGKLSQEVLNEMKTLKWARYFVQYHVVEGKHIAENLESKMNLSSYEFKEPLRVSVFGTKRTILVEGAKVTKRNQGASNGVIHVIDQVLIPPRHTIMEVLERDEENRFTIFQRILAAASLNLTGQHTLFAPTNKAFEKLPKETLRKLFKYNSCVEALVRNHFVRSYLFSKTIQLSPPHAGKIVHTLAGAKVCIKRNEKGQIKVDRKTVSENDVRATDGIIHVIDKVMLVSTALDLVSLPEHLNLTEFSKLFYTSNMARKVEGQGPYTVFAPSNEAFEKLPDDMKQMLAQDPQLLQKVLGYHIVERKVLKSELYNAAMLTTLSIGNELHIQSFGWYKSYYVVVEGSCMTRTNIAACNGILHVIDKVLVPADTLLHKLDAQPRLSFFRSLVTKTSVEAMLNGSDPFTVFAPSNDAISRLSDDKMRDILKNKASTTAFIRRHIVIGKRYSWPLTCGSFVVSTKCRANYQYNLHKDLLLFTKCPNRYVTIENVKVDSVDDVASNGVIHVIDGIIAKRSRSPYG